MRDGLVQFLRDFEKSGNGLHFFMEQLPVPLMLCRGWTIVHLNAMSRQALPGVDLQALEGRNVLDFVSPRERAFIEKRFDRMTEGEFYRFNIHVRTPDLVVDLSTVSHISRVDDVPYVLVAFQDLARLSQREKSLFRLMYDSFSLAGGELYQEIVRSLVALFDVNAALLVECPRDQERSARILAGRLDGQALAPRAFELRGSIVERLLQQGSLILDRGLAGAIVEDDFIQSHAFDAIVGVRQSVPDDVDLVLYALSRKPIHDSTGLSFVLSVCGVRIVSDYSSQQGRLAAERRERDYRLLVEQSADPMFVVDPAGQILMANNRGCELTGISKVELPHFFDLIAEHHHPFFRSFFRQRFGLLNQSNVVVRHRDGSLAYCELSGVILSDGRIQLNVRDNTERLMTEIALRRSEEKYHSIFDNASDSIFLSDLVTGRILECNRSFEKLVGRPRDAVLQMTHYDLVQPQDRSRYRRIFDYYRSKKRLADQPGKFRLTIQNALGQSRPIEIALGRLEKENDHLVIGIIRDLTISYQAIEEHRKYMQTLTLLQVVVVDLDKDLNICFVNNPIAKFGAGVKAGLHGCHFPDVATEDYRWYLEVVLKEMVSRTKGGSVRFPADSGSLGLDWYEAEFVFVRDRSSRACLRGLIKDVTFDYIVEKQTFLMANTDILTSLPNRNRLEEDLFRGLLRADRTEKKLAVGFVDLDRFFDVNDLLGHRMGDIALALFAERLREVPELGRSLYRWGGDQFVFMIEGIEASLAVQKVLADIRDRIREPLVVEGQTIHVTCTIGVSLYPDDARTVDGLFGQADRAMQYGKRNGRFQFLLYQDIHQDLSAPDRMTVRNHLVHAINNGLVEPYLQPIIDLQSGRISGMEALARLPERPEFAAIGPEIFIPIAEDLGIIEELSRVVFEGAFEFQQHLRREGFPLRLSVNVSRRVLYSDHLIEDLSALLRRTGAAARDICLEITETVAMLDIKNASERFRELKDLGFALAIDDFGTGYSTLGQLYEIPVDELKIDKLFVRRIHTHEGQRIAEAIVTMARALALDVVAEGVEDEDTAEILRQMGVRYLQGYVFSPPVSRQDFQNRLRGESGVFLRP